MSTSRNIPHLVNLDPLDYRIVRQFALEKGLGGKGFSAGIRYIIRDWSDLRRKQESDHNLCESEAFAESTEG